MKNNLFYTFVIAIFINLGIAHVQAASFEQSDLSITDSLLTVPSIRKVALTNPDRALALLDVAESRKSFPLFQLNWLRAQIYGGYKQMQRMAVKWGKLVLEDDSVRNNPQYYFNMCGNLVEAMIAIGSYDEAIRYAESMITVIERAGKQKENTHHAYWAIALVYRNTGDPKAAYEFMEEAIQLCGKLLETRKKAGSYVVSLYLELFRYYHSYATWLEEEGKFNEAIEMVLQMSDLVEQLRSFRGGPYPKQIPERVFNTREGVVFGTLAYLYNQIGETDRGAQWFAKEQANPLAGKNKDLIRCEISYHTSCAHFDRVVQLLHPFVDPNRYEDTISIGRRDACLNLANAYESIGKEKEALEQLKIATLLTDSLQNRQNRQNALELATLLEIHEKEKQIVKQAEVIRLHQIITYSIGGILILGCVILLLLIRYSRIVGYKNKVMAKQIQDYLSSRDELQRVRKRIFDMEKEKQICQQLDALTETDAKETQEESVNESDKRLFEELDRKIRSNKLFLDPNLNRDQILQLIPVGKNRIAPLIQSFTGENLNGYINGLRLDYSLTLLKENSSYTIEAIAIDSGFNNVRTYQRIFRGKYGMTPIEYRKTLNE